MRKPRIVPELMFLFKIQEHKLSHSEVAKKLKIHREAVTEICHSRRKLK